MARSRSRTFSPPFLGQRDGKARRSRSRSRSPVKLGPNLPLIKRKAPTLKLSKNDQKRIGLEDIFINKDSKKKLLQFHLRKQGVKSHDPLIFADLPLERQLASSQMGIRYYDRLIPNETIPTSTTTQTVVRQALIPGSIDPSGKLHRTKKHISELFFSSGIDLRDLEPVFKTDSTDAAEKFFENLQNKQKEDLPNDPKWLFSAIQLLGESWHFGISFRKQLPVLAQVLHLLEQQLPKDAPATQLLNVVYHNFSDATKVLCQHDRWLHSAGVAVKYKANPKAWNELEGKCLKRRKEYMFNKVQQEDLFTNYGDIVPNPYTMQNRLQRQQDSWNRSRRSKRKPYLKNHTDNSYTRNRDPDNRYDNRRNDRKFNDRNNRSRHNNNNRRDHRENKQRKRKRKRNNDSDRRDKRTQKPDARPPPTNTKIICHSCGVPGHKSPNCPLKKKRK